MIHGGKIVLLIVASLCIVIGVFLYAENKKSTEKVVYIATSTNIIATADNFKDTDGDGLQDWEETLWGTDPNKPDNIGVKNSTQSPKLAKKENLTATDALARSFFAQYMNLKQAGLSSDKESQATLAQEAVSSISTKEPISYTESAIKISTSATLYDYGNALGKIMKANAASGRNEAVILRDALQSNNKDTLKELDPILASYKKIRSDMLQLAVPQDIKSIHLAIINNINRLVSVVELFSKAFVDPVAAVQGTVLYQSTFLSLNESFNELSQKLIDQHIGYGVDEPGSFFQHK